MGFPCKKLYFSKITFLAKSSFLKRQRMDPAKKVSHKSRTVPKNFVRGPQLEILSRFLVGAFL